MSGEDGGDASSQSESRALREKAGKKFKEDKKDSERKSSRDKKKTSRKDKVSGSKDDKEPFVKDKKKKSKKDKKKAKDPNRVRGTGLTSSSENSTTDTSDAFKKNEEYKARLDNLLTSRLVSCRQWVVVVSVYYLVEATLIIFPTFGTDTGFQ